MQPGGTVHYATWGSRAAAAVLDALPVILALGVMYWAFGVAFADWWLNSPLYGQLLLAMLVLALLSLYVLWNSVLLQGKTGSTWGKSLWGIAVIDERRGCPPGVGTSFVRLIGNAVAAAPLGIGYLFPLWDKRSRSLADMVAGTVVVAASKMRAAPRRSAQRVLVPVAGILVLAVMIVGAIFLNRPEYIPKVCSAESATLAAAGFSKTGHGETSSSRCEDPSGGTEYNVSWRRQGENYAGFGLYALGRDSKYLADSSLLGTERKTVVDGVTYHVQPQQRNGSWSFCYVYRSAPWGLVRVSHGYTGPLDEECRFEIKVLQEIYPQL